MPRTFAPRARPVIVPIVLAALLACAAAQTVDPVTRTVTLAPSGGDDTGALRAAFDACRALGPGCTVRLEPGVFRTAQHVIEGFRGTFEGAGMDVSVIEPLAPLRVSTDETAIARPPTPENPWPMLFVFIDPEMRMRDLGFRVVTPETTDTWTIFGMELNVLATMVSLTGHRARVDVERVAIDAVEGPWFGTSLINGFFVQGVLPGPSGGFGDRPSLAGRVTIRDARFDGPDGGVSISNLSGAEVVISDSVFDGVYSVLISDVGESRIEVQGNVIRSNDVAVWVAAGELRQPSGPSTVVVHGNLIQADPGAAGVEVLDIGEPRTLRLYLIDNRFELDGARAGVTGSADGVVATRNVFAGSADVGIRVGSPGDEADEGPPPAASGWTLLANDLTGLRADAGVAVTSEATGVIVACEGATGVVDEGTATVTDCD